MNIKKRKRLISQEQKDDANLGTVMIRCALFTLIFCAVSALMILIFSWIFYSTEDPTSKITLASLCSLYSSCFICSFALSRISGQRNFLCGIVFGAMVVILTLLLSLAVKDGTMNNPILWRALIPVVTVAAALLAKKRERKPRHKIPR
ncbi:MAG: TIGR04086 family membrane protein [Eubacteriales bacterium]